MLQKLPMAALSSQLALRLMEATRPAWAESVPVLGGGVLHTAVGVEQQAGRRLPMQQSHEKRF